MSKVQLEEDTIDAAGMAVRGIEGGRRVGWAKAYEAMRRADSAERDINMIRSDLKLLSNFCARAYGALQATLGKNRISELFRGDNHEMQSWMPQGPLNQGRDDMRRILGKQTDELNRLRHTIQNAKTELHWYHDKAFEAAQDKALAELMEMYGISDLWELHHRLSGSQRAGTMG